MIAGSDFWSIEAESQKASSEAIADSLAENITQAAFIARSAEIATLPGLEDGKTIVPRKEDWGLARDVHVIFARLVELSDDDVQRILTFVVSETLAAGTAMVEALGVRLGTDMAQHWSPDEIFFELLRVKPSINAMLKEIGGKAVAAGNVTETARAQKTIIEDYVSGNREGGQKDWQSRYMAFPMTTYTKHSGLTAIENRKTVRKHHV